MSRRQLRAVKEVKPVKSTESQDSETKSTQPWESLPYKFRGIGRSDHHQLPALMNQLRPCTLTKYEMRELLHHKALGGIHVITDSTVMEEIDLHGYKSEVPRIIACGTIHWKQGLIHNGKKVAMIEDVVVDQDYRGQGVGSMLVQKLMDVAEKDPLCYKIMLDCAPDLKGWYEKQGFSEGPIRMEIRRT